MQNRVSANELLESGIVWEAIQSGRKTACILVGMSTTRRDCLSSSESAHFCRLSFIPNALTATRQRGPTILIPLSLDCVRFFEQLRFGNNLCICHLSQLIFQLRIHPYGNHL